MTAGNAGSPVPLLHLGGFISEYVQFTKVYPPRIETALKALLLSCAPTDPWNPVQLLSQILCPFRPDKCVAYEMSYKACRRSTLQFNALHILRPRCHGFLTYRSYMILHPNIGPSPREKKNMFFMATL